MRALRTLAILVALIPSHLAIAAPPSVDAPLPPLSIDDRGVLTLQGEKANFAPWSTKALAGGVHVVQYFGATMGDSEKFKPFTNLLEATFDENGVDVTTIINMDAALWGTAGFVMSEVVKNKIQYPDSTIVIDEEGVGVKHWGLGDEGSALMILDDKGLVRYINQEELTDQELQDTLQLLKRTLGG